MITRSPREQAAEAVREACAQLAASALRWAAGPSAAAREGLAHEVTRMEALLDRAMHDLAREIRRG
jgi:hypothetical protein